MLGRRVLTPSPWRQPAFDSAKPASSGFTFACVACGAQVPLDLSRFLEAGTGDETLLGAGHAAAIREHFDFNLVGKSHDGGGPQLRLEHCAGCGVGYLVYVGVQEPRNGHVFITVQGITEWVRGEPVP